MNNCSNVFSNFPSFSAKIQNQFGFSIKNLQTDNAKQYLSSQFQSFLNSQRILHQTSCTHTLQQNSVAKWKYYYLVEISHSFLLHYNVPIHFWGHALLNASHLINCMPSLVLNNQIPYSILNPQQHLHHVPLHVFGSTCFVYDLTPAKNKLFIPSP